MLLAFAVFSIACGSFEAMVIDCELIDSWKLAQNCCYLDETTVISSVDVAIDGLENSDVDGILLANNKMIQFLPVNVYKKFPNLVFFTAENASVKEIFALNFKRLSRVKWLDLSKNQIEIVPSFCFEI